MAKFKDTVITSLGMAVLAGLINGDMKANYQHVFTSTQDLTGMTNENIKGLVELSDQRQSVPVAVTSIHNAKNQVNLGAVFTNKNVTEDYNIESIGWTILDKKGQEILFAVTPLATPEIMPADDGTGSSFFTIYPELVVAVSDVGKVSATVQAGGTVTQAQLESGLASKAEDAEVVHAVDTKDWQKQKITADDGDSVLRIMASDDIDLYDRINQLDKGVYSFYCQGGVPHNPTGSVGNPIRGLITVTGSGSNSIKDAFWYVFATDNLANIYTIYCEQGVYHVRMAADDSSTAHSGDIEYQPLNYGTDLFMLLNNSGKTAYYRCSSISAAESLKNCPTDEAFNLVTRPANEANRPNDTYVYTSLELRPYWGNEIYIANIKTGSDGTIADNSGWQKIATDSDLKSSLTEANQYADDGDKQMLAQANSAVSAGDAATLKQANSYADTGDNQTLTAAKEYTNSNLPASLGDGRSFAVDISMLSVNDFPRFRAWGYYNGAGIAQTTAYAGVPLMTEFTLSVDLKANGEVMIPKLVPAQIETALPDFDTSSFTVSVASDGEWLYLISEPATIGIQCLNAKFKREE